MGRSRWHWGRTGIVDVESTDTLPDGWRYWRDWLRLVGPDNAAEIGALEADQGRYLGYVRAIGRRLATVPLDEPITSIPEQYTQQPLLRSGG